MNDDQWRSLMHESIRQNPIIDGVKQTRTLRLMLRDNIKEMAKVPLFLNPVIQDYPGLKAQYLSVIKYPICVSEILFNLLAKSDGTPTSYVYLGEAIRDLLLVSINAKLFNSANQFILEQIAAFEITTYGCIYNFFSKLKMGNDFKARFPNYEALRVFIDSVFPFTKRETLQQSLTQNASGVDSASTQAVVLDSGNSLAKVAEPLIITTAPITEAAPLIEKNKNKGASSAPIATNAIGPSDSTSKKKSEESNTANGVQLTEDTCQRAKPVQQQTKSSTSKEGTQKKVIEQKIKEGEEKKASLAMECESLKKKISEVSENSKSSKEKMQEKEELEIQKKLNDVTTKIITGMAEEVMWKTQGYSDTDVLTEMAEKAKQQRSSNSLADGRSIHAKKGTRVTINEANENENENENENDAERESSRQLPETAETKEKSGNETEIEKIAKMWKDRPIVEDLSNTHKLHRAIADTQKGDSKSKKRTDTRNRLPVLEELQELSQLLTKLSPPGLTGCLTALSIEAGSLCDEFGKVIIDFSKMSQPVYWWFDALVRDTFEKEQREILSRMVEN